MVHDWHTHFAKWALRIDTHHPGGEAVEFSVVGGHDDLSNLPAAIGPFRGGRLINL